VRRTICFAKTDHLHELVLGLFIHRDDCGWALWDRLNPCATPSARHTPGTRPCRPAPRGERRGRGHL